MELTCFSTALSRKSRTSPTRSLQETGDRAVAVGEELRRIRVLDVLGEHEHGEPR
jgi:hypothetical protein